MARTPIKTLFTSVLAAASVLLCGTVAGQSTTYTTHRISEVIEVREYRAPSTNQDAPPAIVLVPGGGWVSCKHEAVEPYAEPLTRMGYGVFSTNYRVAPTYPRPANWKSHDPRYATWPAQIDDVRTTIWWLRENADMLKINPNRIIAIGFSAGGLMAAHLACKDVKDETGRWSSQVQGAVCVGGPWDLRDVLEATKTKRTTDIYPDPNSLGITMTLFGGTPETLFAGTCPTLEQAWEASPMSIIQKGMSPVLILHGTKDHLVPVFQAERAHAQIQRVSPGSSTLKLAPVGHEVSPDFLPPLVEFLKAIP